MTRWRVAAVIAMFAAVCWMIGLKLREVGAEVSALRWPSYDATVRDYGDDWGYRDAVA